MIELLNYFHTFLLVLQSQHGNVKNEAFGEMTFLSLRFSGSMLLFSGVYIVVASRYFFLFGHITSLTTSVSIILAESHIILGIF